MSPFWDDVSESAKDLVRKLLVVDVEKRLSADEILAHPWVKDGGLNNSSVQLVSAYSNLKKHNARRRFRQGVKKVIAAQTFMKFGKLGALMRSAKEAAEAAKAEAAKTETTATS
jgi:serine/threonine protein kinase